VSTANGAFTAPRINGNGTDRAALKAERMAAVRALHAAAEAVQAITVNGRDYIGYPEQFAAALTAHETRLRAIHAAIRDLTDEVIALRG